MSNRSPYNTSTRTTSKMSAWECFRLSVAHEMHRQKADMERLHDELLHRTRRIEEKESEIEAMRDELEALRRELEAIRRKDR